MWRIRIPEMSFVLGLLILTITFGVMALGYTSRGRLFPLVVIVPVLLLLLFKLVMLIRPESAGRFEVHGIDLPDATMNETGQIERVKWPTEFRMLAWLAAFFASILLLGFLYSIPIFLFSFMKFQGKHSWVVTGSCSAIVFAFIYLMFVTVLSVTFPEGLFFG